VTQVVSAATEGTRESALYLPSGTERVFAVHTAPAEPRTDVGVLLAHSGANNFSAHRNGVWTTISRELARNGIASLRFDFAGTGESSGDFVPALAGQPLSDTSVAMDALRSRGCRRLVVVGSCFGGIPSIAASAASEDVAVLILLSPPLVLPDSSRMASIRARTFEVVNPAALRSVVTDREYRRWYLARLGALVRAKAATRLSRGSARPEPLRRSEQIPAGEPDRSLILADDLASLVERGTEIEIVYGSRDETRARLERSPSARRSLRHLQDRRASTLVSRVLDGPVHGFEDIAVQEQVTRLVVQRAVEVAGPVA
jgi:alpha/beta superfamily hydrolase